MASGFSAASICARDMVLSSSSSSSRLRLEPSPSSSSPSSDSSLSSSSSSSSSRMVGPAVSSEISPSSSSFSSSILSTGGSLDSMASRSRISRSCISSLLSASDHMMMAWKVIGLSHSPMIIVSRPASIRLAMAISPSRLSSSTAPISRKYMRTGSSVRPSPATDFFFSGTFCLSCACDSEPVGAISSGPSSSSCASSSLSTICTPMSLIAVWISSIWSALIWSDGSAAFSSS